jgi:NHL repeat
MFALRAAPPTPVSDRRLERVAGWPVLPDVELNRTSGVALDSRGRIYVAHRGERPLLRLHPDGTLEQEIGSQHLHKSIAWDLGGPVPEPMPERYWLHGLHVDPWDNVWITDVSRHLVMQFDPEGVLRRTFGTDSVPGCDADHFDQPTQVCVLPTGEFFVSDGYGNSRIAKFSADGRFLFDWGRRGTGPSEFHSPHDMALGANGLLYVSDRENDRIQAFHPEDGSLVAIATCIRSTDSVRRQTARCGRRRVSTMRCCASTCRSGCRRPGFDPTYSPIRTRSPSERTARSMSRRPGTSTR